MLIILPRDCLSSVSCKFFLSNACCAIERYSKIKQRRERYVFAVGWQRLARTEIKRRANVTLVCIRYDELLRFPTRRCRDRWFYKLMNANWINRNKRISKLSCAFNLLIIHAEYAFICNYFFKLTFWWSGYLLESSENRVAYSVRLLISFMSFINIVADSKRLSMKATPSRRQALSNKPQASRGFPGLC